MIDPKDADTKLAEKEARLEEIKHKIEDCEDRTKRAVAESIVFLEGKLAEGRRRLDAAKASGADRWDHVSEWFDEHWDSVQDQARQVWERIKR